jgi:hypothetical protein
LALATRDAWDPVEIVRLLGETRAVGGRGAVWALCKRDGRLLDAATVIEGCRVAEHNAAINAQREE